MAAAAAQQTLFRRGPCRSTRGPMDRVANAFVKEFYIVLCQKAELVHQFFAEESSFLYGAEKDRSAASVTGLDSIRQRAKEISLKGFSLLISSLDVQPSFVPAGSLLLQVVGEFYRGRERRRFCDSFLLAPQSSGFFILNAISRFYDYELAAGCEGPAAHRSPLREKAPNPAAEPAGAAVSTASPKVEISADLLRNMSFLSICQSNSASSSSLAGSSACSSPAAAANAAAAQEKPPLLHLSVSNIPKSFGSFSQISAWLTEQFSRVAPVSDVKVSSRDDSTASAKIFYSDDSVLPEVAKEEYLLSGSRLKVSITAKKGYDRHYRPHSQHHHHHGSSDSRQQK